MATKLKPVVVETPTAQTTITPVVRRSHMGRIIDALVFFATFLVALLDTLGQINFASLGLSPTQAAWAALIYPAVRFALTYRAVKLVGVQTRPADGGQG